MAGGNRGEVVRPGAGSMCGAREEGSVWQWRRLRLPWMIGMFWLAVKSRVPGECGWPWTGFGQDGVGRLTSAGRQSSGRAILVRSSWPDSLVRIACPVQLNVPPGKDSMCPYMTLSCMVSTSIMMVLVPTLLQAILETYFYFFSIWQLNNTLILLFIIFIIFFNND